VGQVLDAHGRSYFSMSQMMYLIQMMRNGEVNSDDVIFFEDMFQPGIESLPYILNQISADQRPRIFVRCLAQTIDPDDFVHVWGMSKWMGHYEKMVNEFVDGVLATNEEMVMHMKIAGWNAPIYNISGLAFGKTEVQERVKEIIPFAERKFRVVFSARWDQEKQPDFYMDLIDAWHKKYPNTNVEFCVCSGGKLKSNNQSYMQRTHKMAADGTLKIYDNLDKNSYYNIVNDSRVVFNCALQDWVSNTVSEADALGCNVLYPAYRSFPETFANDAERMYIPWSLDDALYKLGKLLLTTHPNLGQISDWTNSTVDRICDIIEGNGQQYLRDSKDYRKYLRQKKYL
jgi:glycosyltransferase involved in cell wall biosynthesis